MKNIPDYWPQRLRSFPLGKCGKTQSSNINIHPFRRNTPKLPMQMIDRGEGVSGWARAEEGGWSEKEMKHLKCKM